MRKSVLTAIIAMISFAALSQQSSQYVTWKYSARKLGSIYEIRMTAVIASGWHLYAQGKDAAPIPTSFTFTQNPSVTLLDTRPTEAGRLIRSSNKFYPVKYYERTVTFIQKVRLKENTPTTINGSVRFVVATGTQALTPSTVNFSIEVGK